MTRVPLLAIVAMFAAVSVCAAVAGTSLKPKDDFPYRVEEDAGTKPSIAADTTYLASYGFATGGACDPEGWTPVDLTAQTGVYWTVSTDGAINGTKSMWCGNLIVDPCLQAVGKGYGNNWDQCLVSDVFVTSAGGDAPFQFEATWDMDSSDFVSVDYRINGGEWTTLTQFSGSTVLLPGYTIPGEASPYTLQVRFRFQSDYRISRDDNGHFGGAFRVDDIQILDPGGGFLSDENFESYTVGTTSTADWTAVAGATFGDYSALHTLLESVIQDPCLTKNCFWGFFDDPGTTNHCDFPLQGAVPYATTGDKPQYIMNEIWSPAIPWAGTGDTARLRFSVYKDLPLDALVFYVWHVRWSDGSCWSPWNDEGFVYFGDSKRWEEVEYDISDYIDPNAVSIQVALGVWDMCEYFCGVVGDGVCHTHAPLFDDVSVFRIDESDGPYWTVESRNLFQDNFAEDGSITGTVRVDRAEDVLPGPGIMPGNTAVVTVQSQVGLYPGVVGGEDAVYLHVKEQPNRLGGNIEDNPTYPHVASNPGVGGNWAQFQCRYVSGTLYEVNLADNVFTPGDVIEYYFSAEDANGTTYWSEPIGPTTVEADAQTNPTEMTCLPGQGYMNGGDILYVDDADGTAVQLYFESAFQALGIDHFVDRYDVRDPQGTHGNGLGGRVNSVVDQLIAPYNVIIWSSGSFETGTVGDGTGNPEEGDDLAILYEFLDQHPNGGGIFLNGDNIACELSTLLGGSAVAFKSTYISFDVLDCCHRDAGLPNSPIVTGVPPTPFSDIVGPDTLVAYGGCPGLCCFDVLEPAGPSTIEMIYGGNPLYGGVLLQETLNSFFEVSRVKLSGFSLHKIRDYAPNQVPARVLHLGHALQCLGTIVDIPVDVREPAPSYVTRLENNYPNPFNPVTTISYSLAKPSRVRLVVYDVSGRAVRTLVDENQGPASHLSVEWDGLNDAGRRVAGGVYFCRLQADGLTETTKMVLVK